jgi:SAM-dependent methyltransferase
VSGFKDHFSSVADAYRAFRPRYPAALFSWMAALAPRRDVAVDLGCGNGQAAVLLAEHFAEVIGVDPSAEQITRAEPHPRVRYLVAPAEQTKLATASVDLAIAAQAFHWFAPEAFRRELERIARPGAVFVAGTYGLCRVTPAIDAVVDRLYTDVLDAYWPAERKHVDSGYRTLPFPAAEMDVPAFEISEEWLLAHFLGYLGTWSAVGAYRRANGHDPVSAIAHELRQAWGDTNATRPIRWPLAIRAGRVGAAI